MAKVKISNRSVADAGPGERDVFLWDAELTGFGLKVTPAGKKVYVAQYRAPADGRWRRFTIGAHGAPWTPEKARTEAKRILGEVAAGRDPGEDKQAARRDLTVAELCELYLNEGVSTKKESTIATDRGRIARHVAPLLGRKKVSAVTRADVERFRDDVAAGKTAADVKTGFRGRAIVEGGKGTATRTVGLLGGIFSFAVDRGLRPDNPVTGVRRFADRKNERFLSSAELARLGETLNEAEATGENPSAIAALRLLLLTGCRKNEILGLTWGEVDFDRALLRLADSKTGAKVVPLGAPALELLASLPRQAGSPYVLPAASGEGHYEGLPKVWAKLRKRAGLSDVRLHDIRHSFASVGASAGDSLPIIGKLLGHRHTATTARYAHLSDDPLRAAADRIAGTIAATMKGNRPAEVVPIAGRRKPA